MQVTTHQSKIALGSDITLTLVSDDSNQSSVNEIINRLWKNILLFEKRFSRFLPNSELTKFNLSAGLKNSISVEFKELLLAAKDKSLESEGFFNPFILPALHRAGYKQSMVPGYENDLQNDYSNLHVADPKDLEVGDSWARIPHGTAIDMGGCGKGYLAELLRKEVDTNLVSGYWISLGGDIVGFGKNEDGDSWEVEISEGGEDGNADWKIDAVDKYFAVATSGTNRRAGINKGKKWHHILDPRTQLPAETDLFMATIYSDNCLNADILASSAIILGSNDAEAYLKKQSSVKGFLLQGFDNAGDVFQVKFGEMVVLKQKKLVRVKK